MAGSSLHTNAAEFVPWYKNFWPWFIICVLSASVLASLSVVYIAVTHPDGVVRDDWYKNGQAINRTLERDNKARELKLAARFQSDELTGELSLNMAGDLAQFPNSLELWISHPTLPKKDEHLQLRHVAEGRYVGQLAAKLEGRRYIELSTREWRLATDVVFPVAEFELSSVN